MTEGHDGGRDRVSTALRLSYRLSPQSASLTAPSSEGAKATPTQNKEVTACSVNRAF